MGTPSSGNKSTNSGLAAAAIAAVSKGASMRMHESVTVQDDALVVFIIILICLF
jgi:hypothetical protein